MREQRDSLPKKPALLKSRRGQTTMEYVILLFIVVMIAVQLKKSVVPMIKTMLQKVETDIGNIENGN